MSVLADLSIFPLGKDESVHEYVARAVKVIRDSGLPHRLGPMGTVIEGEFDQVMDVVRRCCLELNRDCNRVYLNLKLDCRSGQGSRLDGKVRSVEAAINP